MDEESGRISRFYQIYVMHNAGTRLKPVLQPENSRRRSTGVVEYMNIRRDMKGRTNKYDNAIEQL